MVAMAAANSPITMREILTRLQLVNRNLQLSSVYQQHSQALEAHAASFALVKVSGNDHPSILICFASEMSHVKHLTSKLHMIPSQLLPLALPLACVDLFWPYHQWVGWGCLQCRCSSTDLLGGTHLVLVNNLMQQQVVSQEKVNHICNFNIGIGFALYLAIFLVPYNAVRRILSVD
ncbi:uncharacterized protein [Elaeis guineensis]|uniref:uncharacterized protein isoform X1 n=1 Tax=Elaeis guineensis var. tenera TaxID=51953 RepID=UPI0009503247